MGGQIEYSMVAVQQAGRFKGDALNGIDIRLVSGESLHRLAGPDVPHFGSRVARAGYE